MDGAWSHMTERILSLTLEIICLLTGESFPHVTSCGHLTITVPSLHSLKLKRKNKLKILEATNKMIELLMGEEEGKDLDRQKDQEERIVMEDQKTPPHHQSRILTDINIIVKEEVIDEAEDCTMEEGHKSGHKDLYKYAMRKNQPSLTSLDGIGNKNLPEGCTGPLYSQDSTQEDLTVPHHYQGKELIKMKVEVKEENQVLQMGSDQQPEEESDVIGTIKEEAYSLGIGNDGHYVGRTSEGLPTLHPDSIAEDNGLIPLCTGGNSILQNVYHRDKRDNTLSDAPNPVDSYSRLSAGAAPKDNNITPNEFDEYFASTSSFVGPQAFSCQECGKSYQTEAEFIVHQRGHTSHIESPSCSECEKLLKTRCNLIPVTHHADLSGEGVFSCCKCGQQFAQQGSPEISLKESAVKKPFTCPECGKCFVHRPSLITHRKTHTGERPFSCSQCGKAFLRNADLLKHQKIHTGERPFSCLECGKSFTQKAGLLVHQRKHSGELPFVCLQCGKCFANKAHLFQHQRTHTGERPFTCSECGKSFTEKGNLRVHQRIHSGERRFSCSQCGKSFAEKQHLFKHQQAFHTGERPFSCSECGKKFIAKGDLLRHQMTHTGERPFSCSACGKCFSVKGRLQAHQRTHTGERPYSCADCGKCFTEKHGLLRHQRTHTGERPYSCSECGKGFIQKRDFHRHQRCHNVVQEV